MALHLGSSRKSTNVRPPLAALSLWIAFVCAAGAEGVFAKLEAPAFIALALFTLAVVPAFSWLDHDARNALRRCDARIVLATALACDVFVLAAAWLAAPMDSMAALAAFPSALAVLVVLPLAIALHAAAWRGRSLRKAPAASPRGRPAAT